MSKGAVVLTFDFELGWGSIENGLWAIREYEGVYEKLRDVVPELLVALSDLEIPSTWAAVGALNDMDAVHKLDHLPSSYKEKVLIALEKADSRTFNGTDLIEQLAASRNTKLACHSYSHIRFDHPDINSDTVRSELRNFSNAFENYQIEPTLIFPQNIVGFEDVVAEEGYTLYRAPDYVRKSMLQSMIVRNVMPPRTTICSSYRDNLTARRGSMFFNSGRGRKKMLTPLVGRQARRGLRHLAKKGGELHIWNHPFNFTETPELLKGFLSFLRYAAKLRDAGLIEFRFFEVT